MLYRLGETSDLLEATFLLLHHDRVTPEGMLRGCSDVMCGEGFVNCKALDRCELLLFP